MVRFRLDYLSVYCMQNHFSLLLHVCVLSLHLSLNCMHIYVYLNARLSNDFGCIPLMK